MSHNAREKSRYSGQPVTLYRFIGSGDPAIGPYGYHDSDIGPIELEISGGPNELYQPWPISHPPITSNGSLDKTDLMLTLAKGTPLDDLFTIYPPSQNINVVIREGHIGEEGLPGNFPVIWLGRISSVGRNGPETEVGCLPGSVVVGRPGLRRAFQIGCPLELYGPECRASKAAATATRLVASAGDSRLVLAAGISKIERYVGGMVEWIRADNDLYEVRTIVRVSGDRAFFVRGNLPQILPGMSVKVVRGCNHQMSGCLLHNNILNYGGQPFIPTDNPYHNRNNFF